MLSVIVPVYNVAPYLPRSLDSLAALRPAADEIILVDDGSTDDCPRLLSEFAARHASARIIRQENGGLSAARNTGLDAARGKYVAFVDSDDFVSPNAYAAALQRAEEEDLEMVLFNANYHFEGRQPDYAIYSNVATTDIIPGAEWLRQRLRAGRLLHMVWLHLYRREFIESHRFRFIPRLIHEDVIWTTEALLAAQRVRYIDHIAVHYRIPVRRFTSAQTQQRLEAIVASSETNARTLAAICDALSDRDLRQLLDRELVDGALSIFHKLKRMPQRRVANTTLGDLRRNGFFALLWAHAGQAAHRRRLARHWLRSLFVQ